LGSFPRPANRLPAPPRRQPAGRLNCGIYMRFL